MAGLTDIIPTSEVVHGVTVRGISFKAVADLFGRFPELSAVMSGSTPTFFGGDAIAAVIAAGSGCAGDAAQESAASNLPADVQLDLLGPIIRLTIGPKGLGPFIQKLAALGGTEGGPEPVEEKKIASRKFHRPSSGSSTSGAEPNEKSLQ